MTMLTSFQTDFIIHKIYPYNIIVEIKSLLTYSIFFPLTFFYYIKVKFPI